MTEVATYSFDSRMQGYFELKQFDSNWKGAQVLALELYEVSEHAVRARTEQHVDPASAKSSTVHQQEGVSVREIRKRSCGSG